jgi:hypothetical protein
VLRSSTRRRRSQPEAPPEHRTPLYYWAIATRNPVNPLRSVAQRLSSILDQERALRTSVDDLGARVDALAANVRASVDDLGARVDALAAEMRMGATSDALARQMQVLQAIYEDEPGNRRRLRALRESPEYARPFEEENPLVTVCIPTYSNADALAKRSIPSVLAQTYDNLEVLVIGDAASPAVEAAARSFDDPRLRFLNLTIRGQYPDDPRELWRVSGSAPVNEGLGLAKGQWIAINCDDDVFTPDHVELLLAEARRRRLEFVYGDIRRIEPDVEDSLICTFPPQNGHFGVQAGLLHRGLRIFDRELLVFGKAGDWAWMRRMLRLGVRIGMIDDVVVDYYPSNRWGTPDREPGTLG